MADHSHTPSLHHSSSVPHESPLVMTGPLMVLAVFAVLLGFLGTPAWPWFESFLNGHHAEISMSRLGAALGLMLLSSLVVFAGIGLGWWLYGRKPRQSAAEPDPLEAARPDVFALLQNKYFFDELYDRTVIRWNAWLGRASDLADRWVFGGVVQVIAWVTLGVAWVDRVMDEFLINLGFDAGCESMRRSGGLLSRLQGGQVQGYLRLLGLGVMLLIVVLLWRAG